LAPASASLRKAKDIAKITEGTWVSVIKKEKGRKVEREE